MNFVEKCEGFSSKIVKISVKYALYHFESVLKR